jgi:hypothetical protein
MDPFLLFSSWLLLNCLFAAAASSINFMRRNEVGCPRASRPTTPQTALRRLSPCAGPIVAATTIAPAICGPPTSAAATGRIPQDPL